MGTRGFCRITTTHEVALVKRYRVLLGELAYWQRQTPTGAVTASVAQLGMVLSSLGDAITLCSPQLDLSGLKPKRFRPPQPLPGFKLQRAVYGALRKSHAPISAMALARAIADEYQLGLAMPSDWSDFVRRVTGALRTMEGRGMASCLADASDQLWRLS